MWASAIASPRTWFAATGCSPFTLLVSVTSGALSPSSLEARSSPSDQGARSVGPPAGDRWNSPKAVFTITGSEWVQEVASTGSEWVQEVASERCEGVAQSEYTYPKAGVTSVNPTVGRGIERWVSNSHTRIAKRDFEPRPWIAEIRTGTVWIKSTAAERAGRRRGFFAPRSHTKVNSLRPGMAEFLRFSGRIAGRRDVTATAPWRTERSCRPTLSRCFSKGYELHRCSGCCLENLGQLFRGHHSCDKGPGRRPATRSLVRVSSNIDVVVRRDPFGRCHPCSRPRWLALL